MYLHHYESICYGPQSRSVKISDSSRRRKNEFTKSRTEPGGNSSSISCFSPSCHPSNCRIKYSYPKQLLIISYPASYNDGSLQNTTSKWYQNATPTLPRCGTKTGTSPAFHPSNIVSASFSPKVLILLNSMLDCSP